MYGLSTGTKNVSVVERSPLIRGDRLWRFDRIVYIVLRKKVIGEYVRKFSTGTHLRLAPPRRSFSIPVIGAFLY